MNWNEDDFQSGEKWCRAELVTASGQPVFSVSLYFLQLDCEIGANLLKYSDFFFQCLLRFSSKFYSFKTIQHCNMLTV